jgi:hypothetical protein
MQANEILSYLEMCRREGLSLQRGMNFATPRSHSILLSSHRPNAPYSDHLEENGSVLIYEGHDEPRSSSNPLPKLVDQPIRTKNGKLTRNGLFVEAARAHINTGSPAEHVRVYEKIKDGIWSYNGIFELIDTWCESDGKRQVCKFKLRSLPDAEPLNIVRDLLGPRRIIPTSVKLTVWHRDGGNCVRCGAINELHFDHILPYSKGGTSESPDNIQLLCMRHNLQKSARIE